MHEQMTAAQSPRHLARDVAQPVAVGPLKMVEGNASNLAARASSLAGFARDLENVLVGSRPEPGPANPGRAIPPRDSFAETVGGSLEDALQSINEAERSLHRIREAL